MTRAELVQETIDRGFNYVQTARISSFVDRAYRRICAARDWPFLEERVTGTAPLEIPDLRKILSVKDTTNETPLTGVERAWLVSAYPNLEEAGAAEYWYLEGNTLKLYPIGESADLEVVYVKRAAALADDDEPLIPSEWQYLIVDDAVVSCLKDDDENDEARALKADVDLAIREEMTRDLMGRNHQNSGFVQRTGRPADYL